MKRILVFCGSIALLVSVLSIVLPPVSVRAQEANESPLTWLRRCTFSPPRGYDVDCGYLKVPEVHDDPNSRTIQIAFAIVHSLHPNPEPDPIVYLVGGPGGRILWRTNFVFNSQFAPFAQSRDIILLDQRGTGDSRPNLYCSEISNNYGLWAGGSRIPNATLINGLLMDCHDRLSSIGINLDAYNSAESAKDLAELRKALGYDEWNLFGVSYGTRLALTAMRDQPEGIRSVILDSVVPLQSNLYVEIYDHIDRVQTVLFQGCANDAGCSAAYPDLETTFWTLYDELNENPIVVPIQHNQFGDFQVSIDGDRFLDWLFNWLYAVDDIVQIPRYIDLLSRNRLNVEVLDAGLNSEMSVLYLDMGMYYSVQCREEVPFTDPTELNSISANYPRLSGYIERSIAADGNVFDLCPTWTDTAPDPIENAPVVSDIPTLVLAGEYDPVTPPRWAKLAAETLDNHYYFEAPGIGHGVVRSSLCGMRLATAFVSDPFTEPDDSCLKNLGTPRFIVP